MMELFSTNSVPAMTGCCLEGSDDGNGSTGVDGTIGCRGRSHLNDEVSRRGHSPASAHPRARRLRDFALRDWGDGERAGAENIK
jgi:hypothetical protein